MTRVKINPYFASSTDCKHFSKIILEWNNKENKPVWQCRRCKKVFYNIYDYNFAK